MWSVRTRQIIVEVSLTLLLRAVQVTEAAFSFKYEGYKITLCNMTKVENTMKYPTSDLISYAYIWAFRRVIWIDKKVTSAKFSV